MRIGSSIWSSSPVRGSIESCPASAPDLRFQFVLVVHVGIGGRGGVFRCNLVVAEEFVIGKSRGGAVGDRHFGGYLGGGRKGRVWIGQTSTRFLSRETPSESGCSWVRVLCGILRKHVECRWPESLRAVRRKYLHPFNLRRLLGAWRLVELRSRRCTAASACERHVEFGKHGWRAVTESGISGRRSWN